MQPIFRSQLVWVRMNANLVPGASVPFQDQPILNGCYVLGLEFIPAAFMAFTPDLDAVTTTPENYTLTMNEGSDMRLMEVSCASLYTGQNGGIWKEFNPFIADYQKSRFTYRGPGALAETEACALLVHYARPEDWKNLNKLLSSLEA